MNDQANNSIVVKTGLRRIQEQISCGSTFVVLGIIGLIAAIASISYVLINEVNIQNICNCPNIKNVTVDYDTLILRLEKVSCNLDKEKMISALKLANQEIKYLGTNEGEYNLVKVIESSLKTVEDLLKGVLTSLETVDDQKENVLRIKTVKTIFTNMGIFEK